MNFIDKMVGAVSPERALKRSVARQKLNILNSGYSHYGASKTKKSLRGWNSRGGSEKEDIDDNLATLRERSRDMYMGIPLATGAIKTTRTNVVGAGLKLNCQIDYEYLGMTQEEADAWETITEREFSLWADSVHCDAQRMNNFYELQQIALLSTLMSGEVFSILPIIPRVNMPYDLRVKLIESDRVCTPDTAINNTNLINGIEIGNYGEVVAYYFAQFHPLSSYLTGKREWVRMEKFGKRTGRANVLHLMESERPEQRRGVPILAPVIEALKQLGRYTEAELMAAVVSGLFTVFIKTEKPGQGINLGESIPSDEQMDSEDELSYELGNGSIVALGENESIQESNPGRPNTAFDGFVTSICRQIGAAIEIPYELLVKHFTASYSASRAALLEAWKMFRMRRSWFASGFCQPVYEEWLSEAVAKGRISAPGFFTDPMVRKAYCGAEWNGPSQGQLDPLKEVRAAESRVNNGFSTRAKETVELNGGDYYKNIRQLMVEEDLHKEVFGQDNQKGGVKK